ncbi:hypothetical protein DEO72_LG2g2733 [Vigna unguiculata]|uniref:Uncharacterized protein n=1 Tax=Vigna unguiculata TaxID=3917 RepID=A0A4D6L1P0_VIGUN|nr:hypothetical protein DEO72_LG2g2733 [Vigna unguiculata]
MDGAASSLVLMVVDRDGVKRAICGGVAVLFPALDAHWWRRETRWRWSRWQRLDARYSRFVVQWLLVRRRQWCDGDAVVAGEVRRCGGGCHGGGRREEN